MEDSSIFEVSFEDDNYSPVAAAKPKPKKIAAPKATKAAPKATAKSKATAPKVPKKRSKPDSEDEMSDEDSFGMGGDSMMSATPPSAKKAKKAPAKKGGSKPLANVENESFTMPDAPASKTKKSVSDQYQQLTQLEHILKRPDTYIGSVEKTEKTMWVYDSTSESMQSRNVVIVPGLYKIFDEILVNAADNKQNDKNMDTIKVTIDRESGTISVQNNGYGIPIEVHEKEKIYIPEMIFGRLLTSSNYDDDQQKVTGGRNGYGAKLCNIFSTQFTLETADTRSKKKYKQVWTDNMSKCGKAKITDNKGDNFTKVTFKPDFEKFGMDGIDDDFEAVVKRRVYDLAGTLKGVRVFLNGEKIKVRNFKQYMEMYVKALRADTPAESEQLTIVTETGDRWEIGFAVSDGNFQQISFVNSISTTSGGTHVNYILDQICTKLLESVNKKNSKSTQLKASQIRNHMFLFVNAQIVNPAFTSQTKEQLTTKQSAFVYKHTVTEKFLRDVQKTGVLDRMRDLAQQKADQALKKSDGSKRSRIHDPKLIDANKAGTREGYMCTLILTEGDSAKSLALAGREVVGADYYGVFPLRGKLLNVRDAGVDKIAKNAEIQNIKQIMGLQHKKEYLDAKSLRYGHLMIMTDQDHDGSHIKGLLINFLQYSFPSLLRLENFLLEFITPIIKIWYGDQKRPSKVLRFYSMPEFEAWKQSSPRPGWKHKYYKGLGTSTTEEGVLYFSDLDKHLKEFHTMQEDEDKLIELAFSKKKADERKEWLRQYVPGTHLDSTQSTITYSDFVNKELILFSMADNIRSIPSIIDGFKPGQRKVLWTCFKRNVKNDIKVAELAGHVSGQTAYQHGEQSLQQTITALAQNFAGSNNVNCLEPSGNFGSRLQGGADAASARYIFTRLTPIARKIFSPHDDPLLSYNTEDGTSIEPEYYVPVVPMLLVNGTDGIGTGWSSQIPNYNPEDIVDNLRRLLNGEEMKPMAPWFRNWSGGITELGNGKYKFSGIARECGDNEIQITELPIRTWTQDFKEKLEEIIKAEKTPSFIKDYTDYNTQSKVNFIVQMDDKHMAQALSEGLEEKFGLSKTISTSNMVAFDADGRIHKYNSVEDIMIEYYGIRLKLYQKRKDHLLSELQADLDKLSNQARFIKMIIDGKLVVSKKKKDVLIAELKQLGFKPISKSGKAVAEEDENEDEPTVEEESIETSSYDYLLGMAIWSLTKERVEKLLAKMGEQEEEIDKLIKKSPKDLWVADLDDFIAEWRNALAEDAATELKIKKTGRRASRKLKSSAVNRKRKAAGDDPDDSDFAISKPKKKDEPSRPTLAHRKQDAFGHLKPTSSAADKVVRAFSTAATVPKSESADSRETSLVPTAPAEKRRARAATSKITYDQDSSDASDGEGFLDDIASMAKGIGSQQSTAPSRQLFSSNARPSLGADVLRRQSMGRIKNLSNSDDDGTDYSKLIPTGMTPIASHGNKKVVGETSFTDDSFSMAQPVVEIKARAKPTVKKTAAMKPSKPEPAPSKLSKSPLAAAYAAKQKKLTDMYGSTQPVKRRDLDGARDEVDVDAVADELLSDDDMMEIDEPAPKKKAPATKAATKPAAKASISKAPAKKAAAPAKAKAKPKKYDSNDDLDMDVPAPAVDMRPARTQRAAAANRKKYTAFADSDGSEGSENDFDNDGDSESEDFDDDSD